MLRSLWAAALALVFSTFLPAEPLNIPAAWSPEPGGVAYQARSRAGRIRFDGQGFEIAQRDQAVVGLRFVNSQQPRDLRGAEQAAGSLYDLRGAAATEIPRYGRVIASEVYAGINVEAYIQDGSPEWDFVLAPGADPAEIRLELNTPRQQPQSSSLDREGVTVSPALTIAAPRTYYADGEHESIASSYRLEHNEITIALGDYDRTRPVRIDPTLEFATFFGADFGEAGYDVAIGPDGSLYMIGISRNLIPAPGSLNAVNGSSFDVFVMRVDPTGSQLIYAAVLGGSAQERGSSIAVDGDGAAYITGFAFSADFPVTAGAAQTVFGGGSRDAIVAKLSPDGSALEYATYLGGSAFDDGNAVAVDAQGRAWVAGASASADFPATADALQRTQTSGQGTGFLARIAADGSAIEYASLFGGSGRDEIFDIARDSQDAVWIAGRTTSTDLPVTNGVFQPALAGSDDAFIARLSADATAVEASTYLGGAICERAFGGAFCDVVNSLAFDRDEVVAAGSTLGPDFPVTDGAYQTVSGRGVAFGDGFVAVLDRDLTALHRATFLGGRSEDEINGVAVNDAGEVIVVGTSGSPDFITTADAVQPSYARLDEGFLTVLSPGLDAVLYSTFLGGEKGDRAFALAADATGTAVVVGETSSSEFPVTEGVIQPDLHSLRDEGGDAYMARFSIPPTPRIAPGGVVSAASIAPGPVAPGELLTIFGRGLAPQGADANPFFRPNVTVYFDDVPAPLTYVGNGQINLAVPYAVAGRATTEMVVERNGAASQPLTLQVAPTAPAIFTLGGGGQGQAAVLNQDGTLNGPDNPAPRNSIVTIFATGAGQTDPPGVDGLFANNMLWRPVAPVIVGIGGEGAGIRYLGGVQGLISGLLQINARIAPDARTGPETELLLFVGGVRTQRGVTIAVE